MFIGCLAIECLGTSDVAAIGNNPVSFDLFSHFFETCEIPKAVRDAIIRRVSRLSETCNQLLRTGSVIGRNFDLTLLRALSPDIGEGKFLEGMDEAIGIRIIESVPDTPGGYRFSHALIQQAVYEEIPPMRRAQVHGVIGETLENLRLEDHAENAAELAHHFAEAKDVLGTEKITRYSLLAGEQALATYAYGDSVAHFERGLSTRNISLTGTETAPDEETAALLFGLARAYSANSVDYQLSQSFTFLSRAFEYYAEVGDIDRAVAAAELPIAPPTSRIPGIGLLLTRALALVPPDSHEAGRLLSRYGGVGTGKWRLRRVSTGPGTGHFHRQKSGRRGFRGTDPGLRR